MKFYRFASYFYIVLNCVHLLAILFFSQEN